MCARSANIPACLLLLAFFLAPSAQAKKYTFSSGIPFGLGFRAGLSQNADTDLVTEPQTTSAGFSRFFGFEPFLDFGNFSIRLTGQRHSHALVSGSKANYSESSDVNTYLFGGRLQLAPYISESNRNRAYLTLGYAEAIAHGINRRTYDNGGPVYEEKFEGKSRELLLGAGVEFFLVENYTLQIEGGARQLEFEKLNYRDEGTDLSGIQKNKGDALLNANGGNKKLNQSGAYASITLNLNF